MRSARNRSTSPPSWQLQEAKARFSEVIRRAIAEGPQHVSVRGEDRAVIISEETYLRLTSRTPSLVDHLLNGEPWPDDLVDAINDRARGPDRQIEF